MDHKNLSLNTLLARSGELSSIKDPHGSSHMPIYQTATFDLKKQDSATPYDYTRSGNPTRDALENAFEILCKAQKAVCTHTGLGAVALLLETVLKAGDSVLLDKDTYGGTFRLIKDYRDRLNIHIFFTDLTNTEDVKNHLNKEKIKLILMESPTNPGLKIIDIQTIASLTKKSETLLAVDNSLGTFISQKPLELGADFTLLSTTKYISGHGTVIGGVLATSNSDWVEKLVFTANAQGRSQNPMDAHAISLGLPTLALRMDAHQKSALMIAEFLEKHPKIRKVIYPGLKSHPQHDLASRQMKNYSGVLTCDLFSAKEAENLVALLQLFGEKCSFGSSDSRIEIPGKISHASFSEEELKEIGISSATVRLSIGLEDPEDLIQDLKSALDNLLCTEENKL